jgi:hypothetical protein
MTFENPANGYREEIQSPGLYTLLFGGFYFIAKGIWIHALLGFLLAFPTFFISWLIYPLRREDRPQPVSGLSASPSSSPLAVRRNRQHRSLRGPP